MMPSIISRFLTLTVFVLSQKCVSGTIAFPHSSNSDNEHAMILIIPFSAGVDGDDTLDREEMAGR